MKTSKHTSPPKNTRKAVKLISLFLMLIISVSAKAQFNDFLEKMIEQDKSFPEEICYVHMDREVYTPGDTLWFKAYLREKASLLDMTASSTMDVKIINSEGVEAYNTRHLVFNSEVIGQIELSDNMREGYYQLVCFSSWMKNYGVTEVFRKTFQVKNEDLGDPVFFCRLNKEKFSEGDTIEATIRFLDESKHEVPAPKIKYDFHAENSTFQKGNLDQGPVNEVSFIIPEELGEQPVLELSTSYKGYYFDTIIHIPVIFNIDVAFFPEGGSMVEGLSGQIAFKASSEGGLPLDIEGTIYNDKDEKVQDIKSDYGGMGRFSFLPLKDSKYYLSITKPKGINTCFPLPEAETEGWILHAEERDKSILITAINNFDTKEIALLTLSIRDQLLSYIPDSIDRFKTFSIPNSELPAGIAVLTLFDKDLIPRAERLLFVNRDRIINMQIESDRSQYLPRDATELEISLDKQNSDWSGGSFSLSIVDEELSMSPSLDEADILTSLLLSPEIKGRIPNPGHYFNSNSEDAKTHLELLLLTQGWRKYRYREILQEDLQERAKPTVNDVISGQLMLSRFGRKRIPVEGRISINIAGAIGELQTDPDGRFEFIHFYEPGMNPNIALFGETLEGKDNVEIILDKDPFSDTLNSFQRNKADSLFHIEYLHPRAHIRFDENFTLGLNNIWLEEVAVYRKQTQDVNRVEESLVNSKSPPPELLNNASDPYEVLLNMGLPVDLDMTQFPPVLSYYGYPPGPVIWFINDFPREYEEIKNINPEDIEDMYIIKYPDILQILDSTAGILVSIFTKPYVKTNEQESAGNLVILKKFELSKEFYSPKYDTPAKKTSMVPDLRRTILWDPDLDFDEYGTAKVKFYNGDRYTNIRCTLEGVTADGMPVHAEYIYKISTSRE